MCSFLDWLDKLIPEKIQKPIAITLILSTAALFGLGGFILGGGNSAVSLDSEGKITIGRQTLAEILDKLEQQENLKKNLASYYGPLSDKGFYRVRAMMKYIDKKMEEKQLSSLEVSTDTTQDTEKIWLDRHDDDFVKDELHRTRHYHLLDKALVEALKSGLKMDDEVAWGLRELANRGEGPFKTEKVMVSFADRPKATAAACNNSQLLHKSVYLISTENRSVNQGKAAFVSVDVVEPIDCLGKENYDPCNQEVKPLAPEEIPNKNWLQISKDDAKSLFPLSSRNNSLAQCKLASVRVSLPGMPR
jgi:hypothetical protein